MRGERLTLYKTSQHFTPRLQERVARNYLQESLQALSAMLDHVITKPVCEDLPRERGNRDSCALAFQDVAEILKVGVSAAHNRVF